MGVQVSKGTCGISYNSQEDRARGAKGATNCETGAREPVKPEGQRIQGKHIALRTYKCAFPSFPCDMCVHV